MIDINIKGVLYGIAAALPVFRKQGFGRFVNTASGICDQPGGESPTRRLPRQVRGAPGCVWPALLPSRPSSQPIVM